MQFFSAHSISAKYPLMADSSTNSRKDGTLTYIYLLIYIALSSGQIFFNKVVKAAQGHIPVFLDGGVRRGTDVFKALALGASGVFIGRPVVFSLAAEGETGVKKVLQMMREEFELTMALSGCRSLKEISRSHIVADWDASGSRATARL